MQTGNDSSKLPSKSSNEREKEKNHRKAVTHLAFIEVVLYPGYVRPLQLQLVVLVIEVGLVVEDVLWAGVLLGGGVQVVGSPETEGFQGFSHLLQGAVDLVGVMTSVEGNINIVLLCSH